MKESGQATSAPLPIGLLGGTFDPVHHGHLRVAVEVFEKLKLAEVRLIPLATPGHRAADQISSEHRRMMLSLAVHPPLVLDCCELERGGVSYTVETLENFRSRFPRTPLCLIMGRDAFDTLPTWHRCDELLNFAHIVVVSRPSAKTEPHPALNALINQTISTQPSDLHTRIGGCVYFLEIPLLPIASSDIRVRCSRGMNIRYLVPDPVDDYIQHRQLYRA